MKKVILFYTTIVVLISQSCGIKFLFDPINEVNFNSKLVCDVILKELKIDTNGIVFNIYLNDTERNIDIIKHLEEMFDSTMPYKYYVLSSTVISHDNLVLNDSTTICVSTSLPIIDVSNDLLCILVGTSLYSAKNWLEYNEYYFTFKRLKNDRLAYLSHIRNLKHTNVGAPANLPDLNSIDSIKLHQKLNRIDTILKINQNKISDSLKLKMGIRNKQENEATTHKQGDGRY